ncbi:lysylphosphatidylglycerol synthase domain-containing protein [Archaeoglobus neptunius]|uniref:lysylphosphatidylglycerol synthase domain-containing protein n=1 Tax=Archaeoglobus neptunius TaxID=2798580 RepID=UPI001E565FDE|nr:lysylphosphatidylglycerol synthase domain-containing protein [Archaeoglobus neptunius]
MGLSMIPGGIGVAEASMTGLLQYFGLAAEVAVASTLIIRFGTLWFGVFLGWAVFACRTR